MSTLPAPAQAMAHSKRSANVRVLQARSQPVEQRRRARLPKPTPF